MRICNVGGLVYERRSRDQPAAGSRRARLPIVECFNMQTVLIVFHLMVVIALVGAVLLQRSEGGALGVGGGGGFMTGRGQANALTRATAILAALFFITSLSLTLLANFNRAPKSIIDTVPTAPAGAPQATPSVPGSTPLDQIRKLEQDRQQQQPSGPEVPKSE